MRKRLLLTTILIAGITFIGFAQKLQFTKADSLRGSLVATPRTCYDINYYHLSVKINPSERSISGSNLFKFTATRNFNQLQFDLYDNLSIDKIMYHDRALNYKREFNAVFVDFTSEILQGKQDSFLVYYHGNPIVAKNAPWDGGFSFAKHDGDKDWIATSCQGLGASIWWPNKDQQDDEVDSAFISISVPDSIMNVSNGRLVAKTDLKNGYHRYDWKVLNPINNYNIAVNAANYFHFSESYPGLNGNLTLDYYVLPENQFKAQAQFADVKRMLTAFEHWFGPYPFYNDGYKLVETPYLGMEHQGAVAYGNQYKKGYRGKDLSGTGWGLKWDFIIVHESGHEWFGNNITSKDVADMWIHEAFTCYSESLFIDYWYGKEAGADYVIGLRKNILNDAPIIGEYGVNHSGSSDMYYKGANLLHTIRTIINDDEKWRAILIGLNATFGKKTTTTSAIVGYINQQSGFNFTKVFNQYLRFKTLPILEMKSENGKIACRWKTDVKGFDMPIQFEGDSANIYPTSTWQYLPKRLLSDSLKVKRDYIINVKMITN